MDDASFQLDALDHAGLALWQAWFEKTSVNQCRCTCIMWCLQATKLASLQDYSVQNINFALWKLKINSIFMKINQVVWVRTERKGFASKDLEDSAGDFLMGKLQLNCCPGSIHKGFGYGPQAETKLPFHLHSWTEHLEINYSCLTSPAFSDSYIYLAGTPRGLKGKGWDK